MPRHALEALRGATEAGRLAGRLALARRVRSVWKNLADEAGHKGGGSARRALIRRLFLLGVFDETPLSGEAYEAWQELCKVSSPIEQEENRNPFFSLIMPVYNPQPSYLQAALHSVRAQSFSSWELCVVDDASTDSSVRDILRAHADADVRIRPLFREQNGHISVASNAALEQARAPWCALLDHDDVLAPEALALMADAARHANEAVVLFSDEDRLEETGAGSEVLTSPLFKHGFDPDLFLACNCVSHFGVYRTRAIRELGAFRQGLEGGQDYDLALRCLHGYGPQAFCHVPAPLYHWRKHAGSTSAGLEAKPYARDAALHARQDFALACRETGLGNGRAVFHPRPGSGFVDVSFSLPSPPPFLSVFVVGAPERALRSRAKLAAQEYPHREILCVEEHALEEAFSQARGEYIAFLQAGDAPASPRWAQMAVGALMREGVGAVGCRTRNAQGFLLQAGYALGFSPLSLTVELFGNPDISRSTSDPDCDAGERNGVWFCPAYAGLHMSSPGYYSQAHLLHSVPAVFLSGLFARRESLREADFFGQAPGPRNAVALCLRLWFEQGLRSVLLPEADIVSDRVEQPWPAGDSFLRQWGERLRRGIPFQHPYLDWTAGGWRLRPHFLK